MQVKRWKVMKQATGKRQQQHLILQAPVSYPTILLTINYSISLSEGTNITSDIVCPTCGIIHFLFQQLNLAVIILERFAYFLLFIAVP